MSTENEAEVLVIGAGISGLCAAKLLHEQGIKVIVLEARDRVGGRTLSERNPDYGGYVDLGGAYIGPSQNKIIRIADELGLKTYKVNVKEKMIWHLQGDRKVFAGLFPTIWNPIKSMDLNNCVRTINQMALEVPLDAPWNAPKAKEWDSMTVKEFLDKICWTDFAKEFAANFMSKALLTVEPEELSLLYWLWYIHSGQSLDRLFATADGAQERKFYGGSMTVSEKLAERLDSKSLRLSSPVIHIDQGDDGVTVTTSGGKTYKGRYVISAVPAAISMKIRFNPPLSGLRYQLIQRMPMGSVIKTHVYYDKPYWREKDLNGSAIADFGPIVACFDDTKPDGTYPALIGFIVANKSREMCSLSAEERKEAIANHYADLFNCEALRHPTNYVEKNWMEEEFSGGCYVSALGPRVLTDFGRVLRKPVGHVYFAGTETATQWSGYMDGAVEAGERAAREVLCNMGKIGEDEIWQVEPQSTTIPEVPIGGDPMEKILPSVPTFLYTICAVLIIGIALYLSSWRV